MMGFCISKLRRVLLWKSVGDQDVGSVLDMCLVKH